MQEKGRKRQEKMKKKREKEREKREKRKKRREKERKWEKRREQERKNREKREKERKKREKGEKERKERCPQDVPKMLLAEMLEISKSGCGRIIPHYRYHITITARAKNEHHPSQGLIPCQDGLGMNIENQFQSTKISFSFYQYPPRFSINIIIILITGFVKAFIGRFEILVFRFHSKSAGTAPAWDVAV